MVVAKQCNALWVMIHLLKEIKWEGLRSTLSSWNLTISEGRKRNEKTKQLK